MFLIHSVDDGHVPPFELVPCSAMTPKLGMAMVLNSSGYLEKCGAKVTPTHICMTERASACAAGDPIPVIRVGKEIIFETTNSAAFSSIKIGMKVTLHTDGLQVTATTTESSSAVGVAEVVAFDAAAASGTGEMVRVRF